VRDRLALVLPVYVPTALLSAGAGMLIPTVPLYALTLQEAFVLVSFAVAAEKIGTMLGDVPSGMMLDRIGRKRSMLVGTVAIAIGTIGVALIPSYWALLVLRFVAGVGSSMWNISRMAHLVSATTPRDRGKVLASYGGISRIGTFAGPGVGGLIALAYGLTAPFIAAGLLALAAALVAVRFIPSDTPRAAAKGHRAAWRALGTLARAQWRDLATAGSAQFCSSVMRQGRHVVVPLYGATVLGLDVAQVGGLVTLSAAIDMCLFLPAGIISDRLGRKFASVPCFTIMGLGMALIPFAADYTGLMIAVSVIGLGNGLGSGAMLTLGADLAPDEGTGEFLGVWRMIGDTGQTSGPVIVGALGDVVGLAGAAFALALVGWACAGTLAAFVRETKENGRTRAAA